MSQIELENWLIGLFGVVLLPLLPLVFEIATLGGVVHGTICLTAAMYPVTVGVWCRSKAILLLAFLLSLLGAMAFGFSFATDINTIEHGTDEARAALTRLYYFSVFIVGASMLVVVIETIISTLRGSTVRQ